VLSILWIFGLGSLAAVIMGHIAKRQIRDRGQKGDGLAMGGLVVGYLGIAGIVLLIIAGVTFAHTVLTGGDAKSQADLRNAATAEQTYLAGHGTYTVNPTDLQSAGFAPSIGAFVLANVQGTTGYCFVAGHVGATHWYLYDSQAGGLSSTAFLSPIDAQTACSLGATGFIGIFGFGGP
jgi:hypothetical protein